MGIVVKTLVVAGTLIFFSQGLLCAGEISILQHATEKFARYVAMITGTAPRVDPGGICTLHANGTQVLIGRNPIT